MYDETKPVGQRVMGATLEINGSRVAIEPCNAYNLLTTDFIASKLVHIFTHYQGSETNKSKQ